MTSPLVFIALPSVAVGGVEKRLAGLFLHLRAEGHRVRLVLSRELCALLAQSPEHAALEGASADLELFEGGAGPFHAFRQRVRVLAQDHPDGVVHYGLASPLRVQPLRQRRTLYTIPNASLRQYNARGLVEVYGGVARATRIDVLDPSVYAELTRKFPWKRGSISLTPGSYVDLAKFAPAPAREKARRVVFCGLFSEEKQAPRLVSALPELLRRLDALGYSGVEVAMLGRDPEGGTVTRDVARLGLPQVRAAFEPDPAAVLTTSRVFLSLQRSTNHPSKSLLEAMACGCAPVVTDTRDSERSAPRELAHYVPRDFSAEDLARACAAALSRSDEEHDALVARTRRFLDERFSMRAMAAYYAEHYRQLGEMGR